MQTPMYLGFLGSHLVRKEKNKKGNFFEKCFFWLGQVYLGYRAVKNNFFESNNNYLAYLGAINLWLDSPDIQPANGVPVWPIRMLLGAANGVNLAQNERKSIFYSLNQ